MARRELLTVFVKLSAPRILDTLPKSVNVFFLDSEKQCKILDAAQEVFLRYGFKKATMGDIARGAGMSRPSVYLVYCNKEEILRAVITRKIDHSFQEAQENASQCSGMEARMTAILDAWILAPFKLIQTSPESQELLDFVYSFAPDLRKRMLKMFEEQLADAIRSDPETNRDALAKAGLGIELVARLIAVSTAELKYSVKEVAELEQLLAATVKIHVSFLTGRCVPAA